MRRTTILTVFLTAVQTIAAQVIVSEDGNHVALENGRLRVVLALSGGGRITQLVNKQTGNDMIALWKGNGEIGGALDDRSVFTAMPYQLAVVEPGGKVGALRLEAIHPSGLAVVKTLTLRQAAGRLDVAYEFRNGTQQTHPLWVRNFFIPGGRPLTEQHLYFLPQKAGPAAGKPFASNYYDDLRAPWAALMDTRTNEGLLVVVPGAERFYFWQGSREYPTFEWIYPAVPAGEVLRASLSVVVSDTASPDWDGLARALMQTAQEPRLEDLPGWVDEATVLGVTETERRRGYWLSTGRGDGKQRLPNALELDLPLNETRALYVGVNVLEDYHGATVSAEVSGDLTGWAQAGWELHGENYIRVETPVTQRVTDLDAGQEYRLWLAVDGRGQTAGKYDGSVIFAMNEKRVDLPLHVRIWPVRVPDVRPFEVRGYGSVPNFAGGYEVNPASVRQLDALCEAYSAIGGSVFDWTVGWSSVLTHVKIAATHDVLTEVATREPERLPLDNLPALDFSYFDPWLDVAKKHAVTRVETYMGPLSDGAGEWRLVDLAVGRGRAPAGTPQAEQVLVWLLAELRRYFEGHGFRGFFCKISDEISPEHIPGHIRTAQVVRQGGWRPFTTVTGIVARTAEHINAMNPHCDQWQVSIVTKDDFRRLLRHQYSLGAPEPDGPPPATIDDGDEVWSYGGSSHPYRTAYEDALIYPLLAAVEGVQGYGWWAFYWYQASEKIVWYDAETGAVDVGPAFLGLRDGWRDACLFDWVVRRLKACEEGALVSDQPGALLRLGEQVSEVYRFNTLVNVDSPVAINEVRRALLDAGARHTNPAQE